MFFLIFSMWVIMLAVIILDCLEKIPLSGVIGKLTGMIVLPHSVILAWLGISGAGFGEMGGSDKVKFILLIIPVCMIVLYWLARLAVKPYKVKFDKAAVNARVRAMYGGKILLKYTAISLVFQTIYYIIAIKNSFWDMPKGVWISDAVVAGIIIFGYGFNGIARIMVLCGRLGIIKRVAAFFLLPVPIVGIFALIGLYNDAKAE